MWPACEVFFLLSPVGVVVVLLGSRGGAARSFLLPARGGSQAGGALLAVPPCRAEVRRGMAWLEEKASLRECWEK